MKKLFIITLCFVSASAFSQENDTSSVTESLAQKVAGISVGRNVEKNSIEYKRAGYALLAAEKACPKETANTIADKAMVVTNSLNQKGIPTNIIDVLEAIATLKKVNKVNCSTIAVQYAQSRAGSNLSHTDSVVGLHNLYKIMNKK